MPVSFSLDAVNVAEVTAVLGVVQIERLGENKWETLCQFYLNVLSFDNRFEIQRERAA